MSLNALIDKLEAAAADVTSAYIEEHNQIVAPGVPEKPMDSLDQTLKSAIYRGAIPATMEHRSVKRNVSAAASLFGFSRNKLYWLIEANAKARAA